MFIVTPDWELQVVDGAKVIQETASEFLISTLPNALRSNDPVACLGRRCRRVIQDGDKREAVGCDGILPVVRVALDKGSNSGRRCGAVGQLVDEGATLPSKLVQTLLEEQEPAVARHALGLIVGSSEHGELMRLARESPHMEDRAFHDEYEMLSEVMVVEGILTEEQPTDQ